MFQRPRTLLLMGLVVREVLCFWTGHPFDMEVWIRNAYFVSQGQNPYAAYMPPVPGLSFAYLQDTLPSVGYLPMWSILVAGLFRVYSLAPGASRFLFYFLLKQPTVLADIYLGWLIFRAARSWSRSPEIATRLLRYWMFFPYAIIISAVWGQFDSIVAALLLSSLITERRARRILSLGLGIALKWFPVVIVPFFAFREKLSRHGLTVLSLAVPLLSTVLIFTVMGWDYVGATNMTTSVSHGGGGGLNEFGLLQSPVTVPFLLSNPWVFVVLGYIWVPGILVAGYFASRRFANDGPAGLLQALMFVIVVFYLTRWGVNEQYLMYLFPLFLIDTAIWHPERKSLYAFLALVTLCFVLANNDLLVRFLGPVDNGFVDIAYAADASPVLGLLRVVALYVLNILFTLTCVQLGWALLNPALRTRLWLLSLKDTIWLRIARPWANPPPES